MRGREGRSYFGVASAKHEFAFFPDVIRVVEWIERISAADAEHQARPTSRKPAAGGPDPELQKNFLHPDAL